MHDSANYLMIPLRLIFTPMSSEITKRTEKAWDTGRAGYVCCDDERVNVPHRRANIRDLNETKIAPRNMIQYKAGKKEPSIAVSGVEYSRDMKKILGGPDDVRTIILPSVVRTIR